MKPNRVAFDHQRRPILTTEFDWASVETAENLSRERQQMASDILSGTLTKEDFDQSFQLFQTVLRWIWTYGKRDMRGLGIRSLFFCWLCLEELRPLTLTELARGSGISKQRLSYVLKQLEKDFPALKGCNLPKK